MPNNARVENDIQKIYELANTSEGRIRILQTLGNPIDKIILQLDYVTVGSSKYPNEKRNSSTVEFALLERYPFVEPKVKFQTPILHPNVYTSGLVCLGSKWIPTEGLNLLVKRIVKLLIFDEQILNENSPANRNALIWYLETKKIYPNAFPTDKYSLNESGKKPPSISSWKNI